MFVILGLVPRIHYSDAPAFAERWILGIKPRMTLDTKKGPYGFHPKKFAISLRPSFWLFSG
jgi:hypothetical protein